MNKQYPHPLLSLIADQPLLSALAGRYGTPLYIYSGDRLRSNLRRLDGALAAGFGHYRICYALKANSNPHLVRYMKNCLPGLGGDCASPGELFAAQQAGIAPPECIYTGNYESPDDFEAVSGTGVHINLDDRTSLHRLQKAGLPREISFRLNPGFGRGSFAQITTAGKEAKFGVPREEILAAYREAADLGIREFGLQCMTGSGVLDGEYFRFLLQEVLEIAGSLEEALSTRLNFISIGGGFGIPYHPEDSPLDVDTLFRDLAQRFNRRYPDPDRRPVFLIEPGKYLVGDTGVLLSRVTGLKQGYKRFIGLDAGMETFLRPALYTAYHRILKVGAGEAEPTQVVDVTGRICENTDRMAVERPFPDVAEGDLVAIMDAGAYGFSMASQYNSRPRPAEILLEDITPRLIRQRESIADLFRMCP